METLKNEEIILKKLEKIDNKYGLDEKTSIKSKYEEIMERAGGFIEALGGSDNETQITVYVADSKVIRTTFEWGVNKITIDNTKTNEMIGSSIKITNEQSTTDIEISRKLNNGFNLSLDVKSVIDEEELATNAYIEFVKNGKNITRSFNIETMSDLKISFKNDIMITDHIEFKKIKEFVLNNSSSKTIKKLFEQIKEELMEKYQIEENEDLPLANSIAYEFVVEPLFEATISDIAESTINTFNSNLLEY